MPDTPSSSTLFVIEDNPAQLATLTDMLTADGLHPIGCLSGKEALAACERHAAPVAILDLRLPDMDGLVVLQQIKTRCPGIKVIINTAYASLDSAIEAVNRDAFAYVQKMGDPEELLAHVHRAFHAHFAGYSERLEQEVRQRTAELVQANTALQQEICERKQTEEHLQAALHHSTALLQEVQHRTRNNMQVLSALLSFQALHVEDAAAQRALQGIQARIDAMALIHAQLHQDDLMIVKLPDYIEALANTLLLRETVRPARIKLEYAIDTLTMIIDPAVSFGLLLHELVANALRHGFPDDHVGTLRISLRDVADGARELRVRDTGVGLPDGFDFRQAHTLGFQLVALLTQSLRGTIEIVRHTPGTEVIVRFQEPVYRKRI